MRTKRICDLSVSGRGSLSNQRNVILEVVRRSKTWCACKRDSKKLSYAFVDGECVCAFLSFSGDGFEDQFAGCVAAVGARAISPANISLLFECVSRRRSPRAAPEILRCAKRTKKIKRAAVAAQLIVCGFRAHVDEKIEMRNSRGRLSPHWRLRRLICISFENDFSSFTHSGAGELCKSKLLTMGEALLIVGLTRQMMKVYGEIRPI
jgi:hypothetical protein